MNYPYNFVLLARVVLCAVSFSLPSVVSARVGESRSVIERRVFANGGVIYRDDDIEAARMKGMPYLKALDLIAGSAELRIYFKTADGRKPKSSDLELKRMQDGWDLHVLYVGGESVLEVYRRSTKLTDYEVNHLLGLNAGGSFWNKVDVKELGEDALPSLLGYGMERDDGLMRAKKLDGRTLIIFDTEKDSRLFALSQAEQAESAPLSVSGF